MAVEESLASVEFVRETEEYVAKVQSDYGFREFRGKTLASVLDRVILELQDEFERLAI